MILTPGSRWGSSTGQTWRTCPASCSMPRAWGLRCVVAKGLGLKVRGGAKGLGHKVVLP